MGKVVTSLIVGYLAGVVLYLAIWGIGGEGLGLVFALIISGPIVAISAAVIAALLDVYSKHTK